MYIRNHVIMYTYKFLNF